MVLTNTTFRNRCHMKFKVNALLDLLACLSFITHWMIATFWIFPKDSENLNYG